MTRDYGTWLINDHICWEGRPCSGGQRLGARPRLGKGSVVTGALDAERVPEGEDMLRKVC